MRCRAGSNWLKKEQNDEIFAEKKQLYVRDFLNDVKLTLFCLQLYVISLRNIIKRLYKNKPKLGYTFFTRKIKK